MKSLRFSSCTVNKNSTRQDVLFCIFPSEPDHVFNRAHVDPGLIQISEPLAKDLRFIFFLFPLRRDDPHDSGSMARPCFCLQKIYNRRDKMMKVQQISALNWFCLVCHFPCSFHSDLSTKVKSEVTLAKHGFSLERDQTALV